MSAILGQCEPQWTNITPPEYVDYLTMIWSKIIDRQANRVCDVNIDDELCDRLKDEGLLEGEDCVGEAARGWCGVV